MPLLRAETSASIDAMWHVCDAFAPSRLMLDGSGHWQHFDVDTSLMYLEDVRHRLRLENTKDRNKT